MNPPRGHFSVSRGLRDFDRRFGVDVVAQAIASRSHRTPLRVLEIGCGEGRALMDLRRQFPAAEIHGINRHPWEAMQGSSSLAEVAQFHGIFTAAELTAVALPAVHFLDAKQLPFPDGFFDVVISQGAIHYIDRKDATIEEVWRVLAPDGAAFLHLDSRLAPLPDFLDLPTPRFVIYRHGQELWPLAQLIATKARQGYELHYAEATTVSTSIVVTMRRNLDRPLALGLNFDPVASFNLDVLNQERDRWDVYWGYRSVFRLP